MEEFKKHHSRILLATTGLVALFMVIFFFFVSENYFFTVVKVSSLLLSIPFEVASSYWHSEPIITIAYLVPLCALITFGVYVFKRFAGSKRIFILITLILMWLLYVLASIYRLAM